MKITHYRLDKLTYSTGHGYEVDPEEIYIGDKLNLNLDIWVSRTPCDVIHLFDKENGFDYIPYVNKTRRLHVQDFYNPLPEIIEYIKSHPKEIYYLFGSREEERGGFHYVRSWKCPDFENRFDVLKNHPKNIKNIYRL